MATIQSITGDKLADDDGKLIVEGVEDRDEASRSTGWETERMMMNLNSISQARSVIVISTAALLLMGFTASSSLNNDVGQHEPKEPPDSKQVMGIDLDINRDEIQIFFHNPTNVEINVIDTINIKRRDLPPPIYFKIIELKSMDRGGFSNKITDSKWILLPNYNSYSFPISSEPIKLSSGEYIVKSWQLSDILGRYVRCEEERCTYIVKFRANTFLSKPPNDPVEKETPWFLYEQDSMRR